MTTTTLVRPNGWNFDVESNELSWPDVTDRHGAIPQESLKTIVWQGLGYLDTTAATARVPGRFKAAYAKDHGVKLSDVPASAVTDIEASEYRDMLRQVQLETFNKLLDGYVLGVRGGATDPVEDEVDSLARKTLQALALSRGDYVLPKRQRVAKDDDAYRDSAFDRAEKAGKKLSRDRWETFGEALDAFKVSSAPVGPFKEFLPFAPTKRHGHTLAEAFRVEAEARAAAPKSRTLSEEEAAALDY